MTRVGPERWEPLKAALLALGVATLSVGCGQDVDVTTPTITRVAAEQQADAELAGLERVLPEGIRHEAPLKGESGCYHGDDNGTDGRVQPTRTDILKGLPSERTDEIYAAVRTHLEASGFKVSEDVKGHLAGNKAANGFTAVLHGSLAVGDYLRLTVLAPCVWPDGTPTPKS
ncbi:hypothetical protein OG689_30785 [Kitasatospora sp. NBC_00240]|uniref:hypothetical protein n=1 Tax=Kitasatospora sp. NBC_00240 TaxID=2903567 RepID=UPI00225AB85C|nr:hypothetical protein [Kitasatospora sp. NBC_00240]MCX5213604.1 hypothetical protein [Kitasatospora sp. NBC_00240]